MSDEIDTSGPTTIVAPDGMQLVVNGLVLHGRSSYEAQPGDTVSVIRVPTARLWQPIDTAPAGVWVMVWGARGTYGTAEPCALVARRDAWGWAEFDGGAVEPIHWQPLPAPPSALPARSGSGTEAARGASVDNAPDTEAP